MGGQRPVNNRQKQAIQGNEAGWGSLCQCGVITGMEQDSRQADFVHITPDAADRYPGFIEQVKNRWGVVGHAPSEVDEWDS